MLFSRAAAVRSDGAANDYDQRCGLNSARSDSCPDPLPHPDYDSLTYPDGDPLPQPELEAVADPNGRGQYRGRCGQPMGSSRGR